MIYERRVTGLETLPGGGQTTETRHEIRTSKSDLRAMLDDEFKLIVPQKNGMDNVVHEFSFCRADKNRLPPKPFIMVEALLDVITLRLRAEIDYLKEHEPPPATFYQECLERLETISRVLHTGGNDGQWGLTGQKPPTTQLVSISTVA